MVSEEIHQFEESKRLDIAVTQPKQGAWTRWENTKDRDHLMDRHQANEA